MRIIRIVKDFPLNSNACYGLQPVYHYLTKEQRKLGYDVVILSASKGRSQVKQLDDGTIVYSISNFFSLKSLKLITELLKSDSSTIIHTHATAGLFLTLLRQVVKFRHVAHVHGTSKSSFMPVKLRFDNVVQGYSPTKMAYYMAREKMLWNSASRVLAVSNSVKSDLVKYYGVEEGKITPVYNGVDINLFKEIPNPVLPNQLEYLRQKDVVLYVGHFGLRKGLPILFKAMSKVAAVNKDAVLVCVGGVPSWLGRTNYWQLLNNLIDHLGLRERIVLQDKVPNNTLPNYYSLAKVFVLPSYYEAFPKVLIEAMACSRPVVVTREGGPSELVDNGKNGLLVNYGSVSQLAESISTLLGDVKKARSMGAKGREKVEREFTWHAVAKRIERVYMSLD
ncbi:MAG: glycosyltransferase family 4 protein [Conexivisphaerales archaeon]